MRFRIVICMILVFGVTSAWGVEKSKLIAPEDHLLASAAYVMDATAVEQITERDWLFKGSPIAFRHRDVGRSPYFVGWWNIAPEGSEHWAVDFPLAQAPKNSAILAKGKRFLIVADERFHLLLVYPVKPNSDLFVGDMNEREFKDHVTHIRTLYATVREFMAAVTESDWKTTSSILSEPLRQQMRASSNPDTYLTKLGVPRFQTLSSREIGILSLTKKQAEVVVEGYDGRRARITSGVRVSVLFTLTRTREMMGPMSWEIVKIKKLKEQPWK